MALNSKHPFYTWYFPIWEQMRHCYAGARVVKMKSEHYLKPTTGQVLDGWRPGDNDYKIVGVASYHAYKDRAVFPEYTSESVEKLIGLLHQKPPTITLPAALEPLRNSATINGESLELLLRRINEQQLIVSRVGLLADLPSNPQPGIVIPYIAIYHAETIINWDAGDQATGQNALSLVVLNETKNQRQQNFEWKEVIQHRVLALKIDAEDPGLPANPVYQMGVFKDTEDYDPLVMKSPVVGSNPLNQIPFVFINSKDLVPEPVNPVLLGLAEACISIYRLQADYRQNLFMQGQDTLVVKGPAPSDGTAIRTGAGASIIVTETGDAKYIGVNSQGLPEQRMAVENSKVEAKEKAYQLFQSDVASQESGIAMDKRVTSQTATLNQQALAGAAGLEQILKIIATWVGADPDEVKVTPNLEFVDFELTGQDWMQFVSAKRMGLPISDRSMHTALQQRGLTTMSYEDELDEISKEKDLQLIDKNAALKVKAIAKAPPANAPSNGPAPVNGPTPAPAPAGK